MTRYTVADENDVQEGERIVVTIEGQEIGVFNVEGEYRAYSNWCPHQSGPVCEGNKTGTYEAEFDRDTLEYDLEWTDEGQILNCPWHGWEYDLTDGDCRSCHGVSLPSFDVEVSEGQIHVDL